MSQIRLRANAAANTGLHGNAKVITDHDQFSEFLSVRQLFSYIVRLLTLSLPKDGIASNVFSFQEGVNGVNCLATKGEKILLTVTYSLSRTTKHQST